VTLAAEKFFFMGVITEFVLDGGAQAQEADGNSGGEQPIQEETVVVTASPVGARADELS